MLPIIPNFELSALANGNSKCNTLYKIDNQYNNIDYLSNKQDNSLKRINSGVILSQNKSPSFS